MTFNVAILFWSCFGCHKISLVSLHLSSQTSGFHRNNTPLSKRPELHHLRPLCLRQASSSPTPCSSSRQSCRHSPRVIPASSAPYINVASEAPTTLRSVAHQERPLHVRRDPTVIAATDATGYRATLTRSSILLLPWTRVRMVATSFGALVVQLYRRFNAADPPTVSRPARTRRNRLSSVRRAAVEINVTTQALSGRMSRSQLPLRLMGSRTMTGRDTTGTAGLEDAQKVWQRATGEMDGLRGRVGSLGRWKRTELERQG